LLFSIPLTAVALSLADICLFLLALDPISLPPFSIDFPNAEAYKTFMWKKALLHDLLTIPLLLMASLGLGLIFNACRKAPLPITYLNPETRLNIAVAYLGAPALSEMDLGIDVDKKEMHRISADQSALILDARPRTFFELGHIPSAVNLPRDDFKASYQNLQRTLSSYWNKTIVVYCSDSGCPDSRLVGEALRKLGYQDVRLFRGGWDEWIDANSPTQQGCNCED
jgi:rhodanese-related sulfurtransferase